jgi:biopolymer transport protein ExbD
MDLGSGSGGKRSPLDAALNLVPFIDLMAVTVVFLIMTAVWTQLGAVQTRRAPQGACDGPCEVAPLARVHLTSSGAQLFLDDALVATTPLSRTPAGRLDARPLHEALRALRREHEALTELRLEPDDELTSGDVVQVMDVALGAGFGAVTLQ